MKIKIILTILLVFCILQVTAQDNLIYVDETGTMRWSSNDNAAYFWGVNYSVPFAFSYRAINKKGFSHKEVIDHDIQHFKRLGLNAYRIHVWDRELSDREGNLKNNEHLELLDYLVAKLIENDIYIILTPIAWWGTGYPEPDPQTEGFSSFGSKLDLATKEELIKAQENYLAQFVNHKNKFTGNTYKEEPMVIVFEIINEPNLPDDSEAVTMYVNRTVSAVRNEGVTKPIFFNISENPGVNQWNGVANADIDGVSFQWYPSGLVKGSMLKGNYLPHVSEYPFPEYAGNIANKAKMVYEFDAADIGASIMYPVIANSYRQAGMQWAAMFCYDPTPIAKYNAEYITHYLNLAFTPGKAIGFLIAGDLFKNENSSGIVTGFNGTKASPYISNYKKDLSMFNSGNKFYYSNNTDASPSNPELLEHIAGVGSSSIIASSGTGAYFLDEIDVNTWKLEVFPDAVWVDDPFGNNNLESPVAELVWSKNTMEIQLPGLGNDFSVFENNDDLQFVTKAENSTIEIVPGSYLLSNKELTSEEYKSISPFNFSKLKRFTDTGDFLSIINKTPTTINENDSLLIDCDIFTNKEVNNVKLFYRRFGWRGFSEVSFERGSKFNYAAKIPRQFITNGMIEYYISVESDGEIKTFPGEYNILPSNWGFNGTEGYLLNIMPVSKESVLFDPQIDRENIVLPNTWYQLRFMNGPKFNEDNILSYSISLSDYSVALPEYSVQIYVGEKINEQDNIAAIKLDLRLASEVIDSLTLRFIYDNGTGFIRKVSKADLVNKINIEPTNLTPIKFALLPRPYPSFLPYWFQLNNNIETSNEKPKLEFIQIALPLSKLELNTNINTELYINKISATIE